MARGGLCDSAANGEFGEVSEVLPERKPVFQNIPVPLTPLDQTKNSFHAGEFFAQGEKRG